MVRAIGILGFSDSATLAGGVDICVQGQNTTQATQDPVITGSTNL